ncbi:unnamed protein product [Amoebophrya sp. A25]|nr:unnamed protein product [Amoebophrya sp. A25]|eukprot:GSA25T00016554001.1
MVRAGHGVIVSMKSPSDDPRPLGLADHLNSVFQPESLWAPFLFPGADERGQAHSQLERDVVRVDASRGHASSSALLRGEHRPVRKISRGHADTILVESGVGADEHSRSSRQVVFDAGVSPESAVASEHEATLYVLGATIASAASCMVFRRFLVYRKASSGVKNKGAEEKEQLIGGDVDASSKSNAAASGLKASYLAVWLLAMAADWLQGPYVYALYAAYGLSHQTNSILFIFGFGASMFFGVFVGGWADWYGRRRLAVGYCLIYALGCATKHFANFWVLAVGRVLAGIATSLLYSVFETWLVCEQQRLRLPAGEFLGDVFSWGIFLNSIVAIGMGFVAEAAASLTPLTNVMPTVFGENVLYIGQYCAPFDLSAAVLLATAILIQTTWRENTGETTPEKEQMSLSHPVSPETLKKAGSQRANYGTAPASDTDASLSTTTGSDTAETLSGRTRGREGNTGNRGESSSTTSSTGDEESPCVASFPSLENTTTSTASKLVQPSSTGAGSSAWCTLCDDRKIQYLMLICSFFEASMFIFVFEWTPIVIGANPASKSHPFGLVFAALMTGCMIGSTLFQTATDTFECSPAFVAQALVLVAAAAHFTMSRASAAFAEESKSDTPFGAEDISGGMTRYVLLLSCFVIFEACVGAYWPAISILKSQIVPEPHRATLYNFFRVPLNLLVVVALLSNLSSSVALLITTALLCTSGVLLRLLEAEQCKNM